MTRNYPHCNRHPFFEGLKKPFCRRQESPHCSPRERAWPSLAMAMPANRPPPTCCNNVVFINSGRTVSQTGQIFEGSLVTKTTDAGVHPTHVIRLPCNARRLVTLEWHALEAAWVLPRRAMYF